MVKILVELFNKSKIEQRIYKGAFWSLGGAAIAKLLVLISGIFTAHLLGKVSYGELGIIRSTINIFFIFGGTSLGLTASKYIAEYRNRDLAKTGSIYIITKWFAVFLGIFFALLVLVFSQEIATRTLSAPYLYAEIRIGVILLFFGSINGFQVGVLSGFENFRVIAINTLIGGFLELILVVSGTYFAGIKGAILGVGISYMVICLLNNYSIKKLLRNYKVPFCKTNIKRELAIIWKFTLPAIFSGFMVMPVLWCAKTYLIRYDGFSQMAVYDIAEQWRTVVLFIPATLSNIILPILSSVNSEGNKLEYRKTLQINIYINVGVSFLVSLIVFCFSHWIIHLYGNEYSEVAPLRVLALSTIFSSASVVVGQAIASKGKMWIGFSFNLAWATCMLILAVFFIGLGYGALGLAYAILLSYIFHFVWQYIYFYFKFIQ